MKKATFALTAGFLLWLALGFLFPEQLFPRAWRSGSESKNLKAVREHIEKIAPEWEAFRAKNSACREVELYAYTGEGGMFGARGEVKSETDLARLREFMEGTKPPRTVYVGAVKVSDNTGTPSEKGRRVESH